MLHAHRVIGHKEYGNTPPGGWTDRKQDPAYDMNWRRARVAAFTPQSQGDDVSFNEQLPNRQGSISGRTYGPGTAADFLTDARADAGDALAILVSLDKDLRSDLANKQKLLEQSAQREAAMQAALGTLAQATAAGGGATADQLLAQIDRSIKEAVIKVDVSVQQSTDNPA